MNPADKLQLIRAIEEREAAHGRRSNWVAWASVVIAAVVLMVMIAAARRELTSIRGEVATAKAELSTTKVELSSARAEVEVLEAKRKAALESLTTSIRRGPTGLLGLGAESAIETAVDQLVDTTGASDCSTDVGRIDVVKQLFDTVPAVRVKAYGALLPRYRDCPTLVTEVLDVARSQPQNANGIYNAMVVLSHMSAGALESQADQIEMLATSSEGIGPRVAQRAQTLRTRLPKTRVAPQRPAR